MFWCPAHPPLPPQPPPPWLPCASCCAQAVGERLISLPARVQGRVVRLQPGGRDPCDAPERARLVSAGRALRDGRPRTGRAADAAGGVCAPQHHGLSPHGPRPRPEPTAQGGSHHRPRRGCSTCWSRRTWWTSPRTTCSCCSRAVAVRPCDARCLHRLQRQHAREPRSLARGGQPTRGARPPFDRRLPGRRRVRGRAWRRVPGDRPRPARTVRTGVLDGPRGHGRRPAHEGADGTRPHLPQHLVT